MRRFPKKSLVLLMALALLPAAASPGPGEKKLKVRLVNLKMEPLDGPVSFSTGQVEITLADGRVQFLPYRTHILPRVVDRRVLIFPTKNGELSGIIRYDAAAHQAQSFPLPPDLHPYFASPSFSPDGGRVAFYVVGGQGQGRVRVCSWPEWQLIWESPVLQLRPTDEPPLPPLWKTSNLVEFEAQFFEPPRSLSIQLSP